MSYIVLVTHPDWGVNAELVSDIERKYCVPPVVLCRDGDDGQQVAYSHVGELEPLERALADATDSIVVVLYGFDRRFLLPVPWLTLFASHPIKDIVRAAAWRGGWSYEEHRPLSEVTASVLCVFPGPIIPLSMGSHQRAFQLLAASRDANIPSDLMITGNAGDIQRAKPILLQLCPGVHTYNSNKKRLPLRLRLRRRLERLYRRVRGLRGPTPDLFEERLATKATFSAKKRLRTLLEAHAYEKIVITYAWMAPVRDLVPAELVDRIEWYCDALDVQYLRNRTANAQEIRWGVREAREKRLEIETLASFDCVIAISTADHDTLAESLPADKLVLAPTGFDYALAAPRAIDPRRPVFGFIGGKMDANVKALEMLVQHWWPAILRRWPDAVLRIAGAVTSVPRIESLVRNHSFLREDIVNDGFVASLSAWYRTIDIVLNPVMVQGGLNFKSAEAVMAGKLLVTSALGASCLGDDRLCIATDNADELVTSIAAAVEDTSTYSEQRRHVTSIAVSNFGNAAAYGPLLERLTRSRPTPEAPRVQAASRCRVLIQCGDHLENRERVLPLARAVCSRGHHPVVLVYSQAYIRPFIAAGIDCIALYEFNESKEQRAHRRGRSRNVRSLAVRYRGFDLDAVSAIDQAQRPKRYVEPELSKTIDVLTMEIDRVLRVLEHVKPDHVYVWNGHTGSVANVLRLFARKQGLPTLFLERSVFPDGLYTDPCGVNGAGELSRLGADALDSRGAAPIPIRPMDSAVIGIPEDEAALLRLSGPWRDSDTILFVPLQVQSDTNILLYSHHVKSMAAFVQLVHERYFRPGVSIVVRPHPEEVLQNLRLPSMTGVHVDARGSLGAWLELADLVVTINSTVGLQALISGKPVVSLGRSIYSSKGLTGEAPPRRELLESYWSTLVSRYTCLPERAPDVLNELLPQLQPATLEYVNTLGLDPAEAYQRTKSWTEEVQAKVANTGRIQVAFDIRPNDSLNLTYRHTKSPITKPWLVERARKSFQLPEDCTVSFTPANSATDWDLRLARSADNGVSARAVDRYFWPLPHTDG